MHGVFCPVIDYSGFCKMPSAHFFPLHLSLVVKLPTVYLVYTTVKCNKRLTPFLPLHYVILIVFIFLDQHILMELEKRKIVVFTPSRRVGGKRVVCYDDRFIVKLAHESEGVIVSNDTYRDLQGERPEWKKCIEERLLMYSFVNDK